MAVGDVVNQIQTAGTYLDFQPAAGVQCVVTSAFGSTAQFGLYNGTTFTGTATAATIETIMTNTKIFINNTNYFRFNQVATNVCFTGLQIK